LPFAYAITSGSLLGTDSLSGELSRNAGENVGNYAITQNSLTAGPNYAIAFVSNAFSIMPATLTYLANPVTLAEGVDLPTFTGTVAGFKGGDNLASATTGTLVFTTSASDSQQVGTYPVDGSGLTANNGNYIFAQDPANATALIIVPSVDEPGLDGPLDGVVGAVSNAIQTDDTCPETGERNNTRVLCGVRTILRPVPESPGSIETIDTAFAKEGTGTRLPTDAPGE
jgi:MBG domain (YGX type)